jgi:hypothetical protein
MKITVSQLRRIIQEEIQVTGDDLVLGDIYTNPEGHQISIEFLDGEFAGWELLADGAPRSVDGSVEELKSALMDGGFEFDRNETAY